MAVTFPLSLPSVRSSREIEIVGDSVVGMSVSPFTREQQVYVHQGEQWRARVMLPAMKRANAEEWVAFLIALNGLEGTFLMGDPSASTPRGTWSGGGPLVNGSSQTGKSMNIDGLTASVTIKKGDWFQLGSGSGSKLHKIVLDVTANGSGQAAIDFWPRLRASPTDNDALTIASPKGVWRLASNRRDWSIRLAGLYGITFEAMEAL